MADVDVPPTFYGRFKLERSENFDEYLASKGVNWLLRKMIGFTSVTKVFSPDEKTPPTEPGQRLWIMENLSSKKSTSYHGWRLGVPFHAEGLDGKQHEVTFDFRDGALLEKHVRLDDPNDHGETYRYTIDGDYLVLQMQNETAACKRWFKREPVPANSDAGSVQK